MSLTPGTRLGPYEIAVQIGEGGMGEVHRATDTTCRGADTRGSYRPGGDPSRPARTRNCGGSCLRTETGSLADVIPDDV